MIRKFACFILVICLIISASACSFSNSGNLIYNKTSENYGDTGGLPLPIDINNTTISIMVSSQVEDLSGKLVIRELSERTGLDINIISVPASNMAQQTRVLLSTNELPDILNSSVSDSEINNLGVKGTFVPINKYLNELPNFRRIFIEDERYSEAMDIYSASDGNLYMFPMYDFERQFTGGILYRKDIFDKHNIGEWNSPETFYIALKKLKEIYPDSTPYVSKSKNGVFDDWSTSFGIDFPGICYDRQQNKWIYSATDIRCKQMLDYIRKLYQEGLIDPQFLTATPTSWEGKLISDGTGFVTFDSISYLDILYDAAKNKNPDFNLRYGAPIGPVRKVEKSESIGSGPCITNNKNSLLSLKLLDYLLSSSGVELTTLGIINETYEYDAENKIRYLGFSEDNLITANDLEEKFGLFTEGLYRSIDKRSVYFNYSEKEREAIDFVISNNMLTEDYPKVKLTKAEKKEVEEINNNLEYRAYEFASTYVLSTSIDDTMFDKWIKEAEMYGLNRLLEIYNSKL